MHPRPTRSFPWRGPAALRPGAWLALAPAALLLALLAGAPPPAHCAQQAVTPAQWKAFLKAEQGGDLATMKALLDAHPGLARYNRSWSQWTALHFAVADSRADMVALLLAHGADPNARDNHSATPLHMTARRATMRGAAQVAARVRMVRLLLAAGARLDARDEVGATPLHWAAQWGDVPIARALLAAGADVNAVATGGGWTPLLGAASEGRLEMVKLLLAHGANPDARDRAGRTALIWAHQKGRADIEAVLKAAGARI